MDFETIFFIICVATVAFVFFGMRSSASATAPEPKGTSSSTTGSKRVQMVEDIKMTKTSRIVDQISILDELEQTTPGFRQYCELIGTCQREGGVIAPYSRKQVAYYEIRCYRIENRGSGDVETLVAHEKSFDPFYFKDNSCDTPVYVDINSFGDNIMLINSTNHIEGPNSDFAKAVDGSTSSTAAPQSSTYGTSYIVGEIASGIVHGFGRARDAVVAGLMPLTQPVLALAGAGAGIGMSPVSSNIMFANDKGGLSSGLDKFTKAGGAMMPGSSASARKAAKSHAQAPGHAGPGSSRGGSNNRGPVTVNVNMPAGLGSFLGSGHVYGGYSSVPRPRPHMSQPYQVHTYRRTGMGDVMSEMITGMVLSSVLDSMAHSSSSTSTVTTAAPQSVFRGYRLVEDVVPLGSPIYCIGEIYHHGTDVYMGHSLAEGYPTSFFATRPESEVLAALGA